MTDAEGRYRASGLYPGRVGIWIAHYEENLYVLPCGAETVLSTDATYDVHAVSVETLTTTGMPASMPVHGPTLSGFVFERVPEAVRLIAGAAMSTDMTGGWGYDPNNPYTVTDSAGRYLLCGLRDHLGLGIEVTVVKPGYQKKSAYLYPVGQMVLDFELVRE